MLGGIVVCLDGVTAIAEPAPRFPTAYWIAGFVDYVSRTGHTAPGLSAYFSWPGFFELVALAEHAAGSQNLMPVLRIWPLAIDLLCLVPLGMIFMRLRANWRARWFAAFIFSVGNWVGQDYFSPQSFDYLLYLLFIALLLTWFGRTSPLQLHAARSPGRDAAVAAQAGTTVAGNRARLRRGGCSWEPSGRGRPRAAGRPGLALALANPAHPGRPAIPLRHPRTARHPTGADYRDLRLHDVKPSAHTVLHDRRVRRPGTHPEMSAPRTARAARRDLCRLGQLRRRRLLVGSYLGHFRRFRRPVLKRVQPASRAGWRAARPCTSSCCTLASRSPGPS